MTISTGGDVGIVIVSLLVLVILAGGVFFTRRLYRRRREKQHAHATSRELALDFDTNDPEIGLMQPNRVRSLSDSSDAPLLITGMRSQGMHIHSASTTSLDSGSYPVSTYAYTAKARSDNPEPLPNPHSPSRPVVFPPPTMPAMPVIKEPSPPLEPVAPPSLTTAEHQLTALVSRPSFLAKPRSAPRPSMRRAGSRGAQGLRATVLTRLASSRWSRSADAMDDEVSPSSVYSQASAAYAPYRSSVDFADAFVSEAAPPMPPIPEQYRSQNLGVAGWKQGPPPPNLTTPPEAQPAARAKSLLPLEDSHAFPLPVTSDVQTECKTPTSSWFSTLWTQEPSSAMSPSPPHSPGDRISSRPSMPGSPNVRSLEVLRNMPQYSAGSEEEAQQGAVGYQLPPNWRTGQAVMPMPTTHAHGYGSNTPKAARAAMVACHA